jgi:GT2 family glycosyltransferase
MAPEVAVVVPTHDRAARALRMVDALEAQTLAPSRFEVVIVDDCSTDDTVARLEARLAGSPLRASVRTTPTNLGPAAARNVGWRSTSAAVVAFTDDDCVPAPGWLTAIVGAFADPSAAAVGVVQGRVEIPAGARFGDWTLFRKLDGPSPFFEGCNVAYRRAALEATGGFDEDIGWYGEDAALGWAVVDAGWDRAFAGDAAVTHDVEERGLGWHVRNGFNERNLVTIAARHPRFRDEAFWKPWAFRRENVAVMGVWLAVLGVGRRRWPLLALALPWLRWRRPPPRHHRAAALVAERLVVDSAQAAGLLAGSVRSRILVL